MNKPKTTELVSELSEALDACLTAISQMVDDPGAEVAVGEARDVIARATQFMTDHTDYPAYFSIYKIPGSPDRVPAEITGGYELEKVIQDASDYYCRKYIDDGYDEWDGVENVKLVISQDNETKTHEWEFDFEIPVIIEKDDYDGGRFDYNAAIGAVRTI